MMQPTCACGSELSLVDRVESAATLHCERCHRCYLAVEIDETPILIQLKQFYLRRLGPSAVESPDDLGRTLAMSEALRKRSPINSIDEMDFGLDTPKKRAVVRELLHRGLNEYCLDRVRGDGAAITALVDAHLPEARIHFSTPWDTIISGIRKHVSQSPNLNERNTMSDSSATNKTTKCPCSNELREVDRREKSNTLHCDSCHRTYLGVESRERFIELRQFYDQRLGPEAGRDVADHSFAEALVDATRQTNGGQQNLSQATLLDFGITTTEHFEGVRKAVEAGLTAYELDRVLGDGPAITALIGLYVDDLEHTYATAWDELHHQRDLEPDLDR